MVYFGDMWGRICGGGLKKLQKNTEIFACFKKKQYFCSGFYKMRFNKPITKNKIPFNKHG
jgi:hypothetical protein